MKARGLLILIGIIASSGWCADAVPDSVREDWYFRESLNAIRDWETILERWEQTTPAAERTPRLPIPRDGSPTVWPDPTPSRLVPSAHRSTEVVVKVVGETIEVCRGANAAMVETVAPGSVVVGYEHPGGGGKDHWYHKYDRRFDQLLHFEPQLAPFALEIVGTQELRCGQNVLEARLRNVTDQRLTVEVRLDHHRPKDSVTCGKQTIALDAHGSHSVRMPVTLDQTGGRLLVLTLATEKESYWLPILTDVEDAEAVLASIEQVLVDTPNAAATEHLGGLRRRVASWKPVESPTPAWSALFEEASQLRDDLLLARINVPSILFLERKPYISEQPFMDAHHLENRPGGEIARLGPVRPTGTVTPVVNSLGKGIYRDVCLHPDADRFLFAFGNGSDHWDGKPSYHIFEATLDGSSVRQLTTGPKNDCEPFYWADGKIGFTSDRSEHFVMCGGDRHAPNLFVMKADGSDVRQLSNNTFNEFTPTMLDDGRLLYSRWEYNERSVTSLHHLFTMRPDGSMVAPYYGNATIRPNVIMSAHPVPDSEKVLALFTAHHGQTHGAVGLIDVRKGIDGPEPVELLTPGVPVTGEKAEDSRHGWFSFPMPLTEDTWLCSYTPTVLPWLEWSWGLYVADRYGNLALVYRDPTISCTEPLPIVKRAKPAVLTSLAAERGEPFRSGAGHAADPDEATLVLGDVTNGLTGVSPGTAKYLRILDDLPRVGVLHGGVIPTTGTSIYTIKRILGTVPIEPDGSAHFVVPANRNVYFEVLDAQQREIQRMRSVVCLAPGESRSCIGCHEKAHTAPPSGNLSASRMALSRPASRPVPPPWGTETISFLRDVQPILNVKCISCHAYDREANHVILTDDLTDQFSIGYEELLPFISFANAMRWDNPEDVLPRPPYTYGSGASRLCKMLEAGHHGVVLSEDERLRIVNWVDANAVYYDRYENDQYPDRRIVTGPFHKTFDAVFDRRCASCHGRGDGKFDTWALSINRRDVHASRALAAPLARSAGGWGACDGPVFADTSDPDYKLLAAALEELAEHLHTRPREDLIAIQGTFAESQPIEQPALPAVHRAEPGAVDGQWAYLSDLPWESAHAGWSPNNDGLPRRDLDIEDHPVRLASRRYRKGIGTHAPSEIAYRLDGTYDRFCAEVGGAQAGGSVIFEVSGDGQQLYRSKRLHGLREVESIDLSISGVRVLKLVVTDGGDGYIADMANWAGARVRRTTGSSER